jgi:phosphatidylinositol phospholipase C delta
MDYLKNDQFMIYSRAKRDLYLDMTQPWTDYLINSSHNTYLTGDQLGSNSSVDAYTAALNLGCRCVELDCWDSPNGPVVYHGHTLTSKIMFIDVIKTINRDAFRVSDYPLILSLEVHCGVEQQDKMAEILMEILGDKLVSEPINGTLTPLSLKKKIIVKGKAATDDPIDEMGSSESLNEITEIPSKKDKKKPVLSQKLGKLAIYQKSKKLHGGPNNSAILDSEIDSFSYSNVASLSETKATKMISSGPSQFMKFTSNAFARIYPKVFKRVIIG